MKASSLERLFFLTWRAVEGPELQVQHKFHPERKWRFDFAEPTSRVAVELEGGTWINGAHTRGTRYEADCEKYNVASVMGWTVIRLTREMIGTEWAYAIKQLIQS